MNTRQGFGAILLVFVFFTLFYIFNAVSRIQKYQAESFTNNLIPQTFNPPTSITDNTINHNNNNINNEVDTLHTKSLPKLPIILYWTAVSGFMGKHMLVTPSVCPVACEFIESQSRLSESSAVVFLLPAFSQGSRFPDKHENQSFVALSMESDMYYTQMKDEKFMNKFDIRMTYRQSAEITTLYFSSKANYLDPPDPIQTKSKEALMSVFVSNSGPLNERNKAIDGLCDLLPCHSFGRHHHNKDMPEGETKKSMLRKYKFHLAFENSNTPDYVTEKIFQALQAGTVPIYLGAPNIDQYMPSNHSIIKLHDFESYEKLAEYIKYLDQNDEEYEKYLEWKKHPYSGNFKKIKEYVKYEARCKLCMILSGLEPPKLELT